MNDFEDYMARLRRERLDDERREKRDVLGCAGALSLLLLALVALVFVGCPAAVSYGVSNGCASGAEHAR